MTIDQDTGRPPPGTRHHGEPAPGGGAQFTCATCGAIAAVVRLAPAGTLVDMGPPMGTNTYERNGVAIRWLGRGWKELSPATWARASQVLTAAQPDPGALHAIDWELAPFWCRDCRRCYCRDDWLTIVIMDEGFYDYTDGLCPAGHHQILDD
jgi:hypothetical protein